MGSRTVLSVAALALVVASACGDEDTSSAHPASGGSSAAGGATLAGGASPLGGTADGGLPSQGGADGVAGMGGALALGGSAAAGGAAGSPGGVSGSQGWTAGTLGAGAIGGGGAVSGPSGTGDAGAGGRAWPGQDDESWGGMDGLGGTRCWWPGVEEEDMGKITRAYDLPADIEACAQEQCESSECGPGGSWSSCSNCTRGHDECRCACRQLYLECGDCEAYSTCIGYCLVMHC